MSDQNFPLEPGDIKSRRPSSRSTIILEKLMDDPRIQRKTPIGTDTAWAMKLKACVDTVAREFHIDVLAAKPVKCFAVQDSRDMLFEVDTSCGQLEVLRNRSGEHTFNWKSDGADIS